MFVAGASTVMAASSDSSTSSTVGNRPPVTEVTFTRSLVMARFMVR